MILLRHHITIALLDRKIVQRIARLVSCEADKKAIVWFRYTAVVNTCAVLCVMYFFHICTILSWEDFLHGTLKNSLYSIYFTTKRKWWKYRDEEMKHRFADVGRCFNIFWQELLIHHEMIILPHFVWADAQANYRFGSWQAILEMDATKELIMHWYYVAMMQRIKNNNI
ncbi:hypothetical protein T09_15053 [Trichinella sp. T9]|nr:hypothetical protein T09_15053 [Trichinella sp. T9]